MQKLVLLLVALLCFSSYSNAQVATNPRRLHQIYWIQMEVNGQATLVLDIGVVVNKRNYLPCNDPNLLPSTTGFNWGCNATIVSTTIAINQALQVAGIQVNGFEYEWKVKNGNANIFTQQPGIDDFVIEVDIYDAQGNLYATYQYDYSYSHNWTTHSRTGIICRPLSTTIIL